MTVAELIAALCAHPPETKVGVAVIFPALDGGTDEAVLDEVFVIEDVGRHTHSGPDWAFADGRCLISVLKPRHIQVLREQRA